MIDTATGRSSASASVAVTVLAREAAWAEVATKAALLSIPGCEVETLEELGCDGVVVAADGSLSVTHNIDRFVEQPVAAS